MAHIESSIRKASHFVDERHAVLTTSAGGLYGPNIGVDGRNLTILFLSLNRVSLSIRLLSSIAEHLPDFAGEVLVADNGSAASELELLKQYLTSYRLRWRLVELDRNYGVAGGRNRSIAQVKTDWVISLDNDIFFTCNPLPQIQRDLSVLGCHFLSLPLLNPDSETLYAFGGHLQTVVQNGRPRLTIATVLRPNSPVSAVQEVAPDGMGFLCSFVFGGASVFNRQSFDRLGGFDENMFVGFEDIDLSLRLFREGLKVGCSAVLALVHDHPKAEASSDADYERMRFSRQVLQQSAQYLEDKHGFVIWGSEIDGWLDRNEAAQGFHEEEVVAPAAHAPVSISESRPRIALITDTDDWAFANISRQLLRYLGDQYDFKIIPLVQLGEIEQARSYRSNGERAFVPGGASAFGQGLLLANDCDIVHVFWREFLTLIDSKLLSDYASHLGLRYEEFRRLYLEGRVISTSVYDHLFLDEASLRERKHIFTDIVTGYYVSSQKLETIYSQLEGYPTPEAVLEDGVDLTLFRPMHLDRFDDIGARPIVIGWVGNSSWAAALGDNKGVQTILIPAIDELRAEGVPVRLNLADRQEQHIPHDRMPEYYRDIDLYICTSNIEGTPNPVLEAMACGVPIISTDVGIVPQALGPLQRQFILRHRSVACLKEAIRDLASSPHLFRQLSVENLERVKSWSWETKAKNFSGYFDRLLERKRRAEGTNRTKMCMLPFTSPSMETDGSIRLCSAASIFSYRDETNMGNCRDEGLRAVWRGQKYRRVRETLLGGEQLRPYCDACEYRHDGPAWVLQMHAALHSYQAGVRSHSIRQLIAARSRRYEEYRSLCPGLGLAALPLPAKSELAAGELPVSAIKPAPVVIPEELIDAGEMPLYVDLNSLNRCNVSCTMCPYAIRYDDLGEKKDKYYRLTLDEYKKVSEGLNVATTHFVGAYAEPLLNKEIFSLIAYAHSKGSFTAVTSNGMALIPKFAERLVAAGLDMLTISLHGARKETAEAVMRGARFDRVVSNIRGLQAHKNRIGSDKPELYFNYVGMKVNVADLPDFVTLAAELGVKHVHFIHLIDGDEVVDKAESLIACPELLWRYVPEARERAARLGVNLYVSPAYEDAMRRYSCGSPTAAESLEAVH